MTFRKLIVVSAIILWTSVQPGHLGMIYSRIGGLDDKSNLKEGLNFVIPWFQRPIIFDIRTRPQVIKGKAEDFFLFYEPNANEQKKFANLIISSSTPKVGARICK